MPLTTTFTEPFFTGGPASLEVPSRYDCALDGRPYMIDARVSVYTGNSDFMHQTVPLLRSQADQGASPTESSINPDDLWRRSQDTWHLGAGQTFLDRKDSDPARFHTSKGVDVWTRWQLGLLPDTDDKHSSVNTNLALVAVGTYLYYVDGAVLRRTGDITVTTPTWTVITGTPGGALLSITTDGYNVYVTDGANIYSGVRGGATVALWSAFDSTLLGFVKGRLMSAAANVVSNITAAGVKTDVVTQANTDFTWVGFAEGPGQIYMAGFSGDKSLIYKTAIKADGSALDVGTVAGELPDGEIVRSIQGYLGWILVGTDKGVRFGTLDTAGNITFGSVIPTGSPVRCFEPQDRFCWYGLTNYDVTSTGLGRLDLQERTNLNTPAYASDLMVTAQGAVLSVVTFQSLRVFAVSGIGVYAETTTLVASGTIESGQITYSLPDEKVGLFVDVHHDLVGTHAVSISGDGGAFTPLGSHDALDTPFAVGEIRAARFEIRLTLSTLSTVGPTIRSWTLRSYPTASPVLMIVAPLLLAETLRTRVEGDEAPCDPAAELAAIDGLRRARSLVSWQEGNTVYSVTVEDYEWHPANRTKDGKAWNGTLLTKMKAITA